MNETFPRMRAWNKEEQQMYPINYYWADGPTLLADNDQVWGKEEDWVFLRSTDLPDKKGKEIFAGDVVRTTHDVRVGTRGPDRRGDTFAIRKTITENGVVVYRDGKWLVEFSSRHRYESYFWTKTKRDRPEQIDKPVIEELADNFRSYEIVGSIYDNPELIPKEG